MKAVRKPLFSSAIFAFSIVASLFLSQPAYSEEDPIAEITESINEIPYAQDFIEEKTKHTLDWFLNANAILIYRTINSKTDSPYSSTTFPYSLGLVFPAEKKLNFQPALSFFSAYYQWDGENAFPAKQEDSTNIAFCFLIDCPVCYNYTLNEKHFFEAGSGISFDIRFSKTMNGLNSSDKSARGTVEEDVKEINKWFWKGANFLYWNFSACYMYNFKKGIKVGPEIRYYIPLGSALSGNGFNGSMLSLGAKIRF